MGRRLLLGAGAGLAFLALVAAGPRPGSLLRVDPARPDLLVADVAGLLAWLCLLWLTGGVLLALAARLPGAAGRVAAALAPAVLRRLVEAAVGLSVVTGAVGAVALPPAAAQATLAEDPGPLDRPVAPPGPAALAAAPPSGRPGPRPALEVVVVRGDTLWDIAERTLGESATASDVDAEWRRWYAANRAVVGPDPDLIHPGQRLRPPAVS